MLSWLASDYFAQSPLLAFPVIAMILFMAVFSAMAFRAMRTTREELDRMAQLPLRSERYSVSARSSSPGDSGDDIVEHDIVEGALHEDLPARDAGAGR
ncbi:MAG: hypothetical protein AAF355_10635 [Myxococcota bacterium]